MHCCGSSGAASVLRLRLSTGKPGNRTVCIIGSFPGALRAQETSGRPNALSVRQAMRLSMKPSGGRSRCGRERRSHWMGAQLPVNATLNGSGAACVTRPTGAAVSPAAGAVFQHGHGALLTRHAGTIARRSPWQSLHVAGRQTDPRSMCLGGNLPTRQSGNWAAGLRVHRSTCPRASVSTRQPDALPHTGWDNAYAWQTGSWSAGALARRTP
jgi:hypothetical protein